MIVKTYRSVLDEYRTHPETKSLGSDGKPCGKHTRGLLSRQPVKAAAVHYIGKESNKIEEALSGLVDDLDDVLTEYHNPAQNPFQRLVVPILRELPVAEVAAGAGVSARTVERARAGQPIGTTAQAKLTAHAITHARAQLHANGTRPPTDHEAVLATYLDRNRQRLCACGCGEPVSGRKRYHTPACRVKAHRAGY